MLTEMPSRNDTSLTLIESVRNNAAGAWDRFVEIYSPLIYYWCTTKAQLPREDASDIMQDVFLSISKSIGTFRRDETYGSLRGWIRVITTNQIRSHIRHGGKEATAQGGTHAHQQLNAVPETLLGTDDEPVETSILMRKALDVLRNSFSESSYQAFWLTAMEGKTTAEVAQSLGLTESATRQACYRVRKRLRDELDEF